MIRTENMGEREWSHATLLMVAAVVLLLGFFVTL